MAASSERSPPPFPESEEQELEPDLEEDEEDSEEGADIFTGGTLSDSPMDPPLPVSSSEPPKDIFSEPPADSFKDPLNKTSAEPEKAASGGLSKVQAAVPVKEAAGEEPDDLFSDPLGESGAAPVTDAKSAPLLDLGEQPPKSDVIKKSAGKDDASTEVLSAPQNDVIKKSQKDIFEEPPKGAAKDLPTDVKGGTAPGKKPASADLFGDDDDEDLFKEPLGAVTKKPQGSLFTEAKSELKAARPEQSNNAAADLFTEEAFTVPPVAAASAPAAAKSNVNTSSKTNGLHSDEEDLFAEATVELSLDSPHNDRRKREAAKPSAPAPSLSASASTSKPQPKTLEELEEEEKEDTFDLNISVTNPEKVGDGMNAYMAYKVSTQTSLSMFRSKQFTVRRRFSDFLGLYEKLSEKHAQNGYIVPPPPEKSILGMTKVKVGKEDPSSAEFVERRRAALERYLQRVVSHPSLLQDPDVREFLEKEELPRAVSTQALSGAGFLKMINKATDAVSKMTIKMNESDVWFEEKLQEVESEDQQLKKLHAMVESLVNHRKELSVSTAVFAKSVAMLGSSEDNTALSRALSQLAEVEDRIEQLHQDQASNDFFIFAELLADYVRLLGAVRASFDQRMKAWQRWQDAQNMLQKKRETEAKLLWANKPDKLQQAKDEIVEWEAKVSQYERDFERVSATVRKEVIRFEKEKSRDFKKQIIRYLESLLQSQQQLIKYWEAFLPEAKAIA
ncbi:sorting nexin-1a isoform X2 [Colossoma macropomum]|uniref:sorting nexin-1a isoform X2 n=1 Tax=Colossoma macropomum TaxID=42526 RepID=UPI0018655A68|nr:sorting nexin-1a isoform X2 [Colossoma macropomum]